MNAILALTQYHTKNEEIGTQISSHEKDDFYKKAGKICFFFHVNDSQQFSKIKKWVTAEKADNDIFVTLFCDGYIPENLPKGFVVFTKRNFNFLGKKTKQLQHWIAAHQFDMLISFVLNPEKKEIEIIKSIHSKIKVGAGQSEQLSLYHINIDYFNPTDFENFYNWIIRYFLDLNIKILHNENES